MKSLAQLQHNFQQCLLERDDAAVLPAIAAAGRAAPDRQLSVYSNAYRLRLREVLENDYPVLAAAVGDAAFDELAEAYITSHPSQGFSLRSFGADLAALLRSHPGYREIPVLAELASFEWTLGKSFDAGDDPVMTIEAMAHLAPEDWPGVQLVLHASVQRIDCAWNTVELWKAHQAGMPLPELQENATPVPWLIWRKDLKTVFRSLENDEQRIFDAARHGACFAELCEILGKVIPPHDVPLRAASILKRWISDGLVSRIMSE